jgi:hypothetical protein
VAISWLLHTVNRCRSQDGKITLSPQKHERSLLLLIPSPHEFQITRLLPFLKRILCPLAHSFERLFVYSNPSLTLPHLACFDIKSHEDQRKTNKNYGKEGIFANYIRSKTQVMGFTKEQEHLVLRSWNEMKKDSGSIALKFFLRFVFFTYT